MAIYRISYSAQKSDRLDKFLTDHFSKDPAFSYLTRSQILNLIQQGHVTINGSPVSKAGFAIRSDCTIELKLDNYKDYPIEPFDFKIKILYEDQDILVIDKPAGISMHPGAGKSRAGTIINALSEKLKSISKETISKENISKESFARGPVRPGIVHRLDKDTTGVVVLAKNIRTHQQLSEQFANRSVTRKYIALILLSPRGSRAPRIEDNGRIESNIGRHAHQPTKMSVTKKGGRFAATNWNVVERMKYAALVELKLETGRTHQIRVHLDSIGCPVIGDRTYGDFSLLPKNLRIAADTFGRQALHAATLQFVHPESKKELTFKSDVPKDFEILIDEFRNYK